LVNGYLVGPLTETQSKALYKSGALGSNRSNHVNQNGAIGISSLNSNGRKITFIPTVTIGTQIWSSTNLDVTTYRDGTPIPEVQDPTAWANLTTGAWCHLNNDPANDAIYGKMYNHYAVEDPRGLAPVGFHIPTFAEYTTLIEALPLGTTCPYSSWLNAPALMSSSFYGGTNTTGFSALNGGFRYGFGVIDLEAPSIPEGFFRQSGTIFWSSDPQGELGNFIYLGSQCAINSRRDTNNVPNNRGAYIRLIKD
jgi:uncharacterized protein (TIGR02145 family)